MSGLETVGVDAGTEGTLRITHEVAGRGRFRTPRSTPRKGMNMKTSTPIKPPRRYTRFCGIDVAKRKHVACILDRDGAFVARSPSFNNDAEGFQQILARLHEAGGPGASARNNSYFTRVFGGKPGAEGRFLSGMLPEALVFQGF